MANEEAQRKFSVVLRRLLRERDLSQSDLSRRSSIGRDSISGYVRGKNAPNARNLARLASALRVTQEELLGVVVNTAEPAVNTAQDADKDDGILKMVQLPGDLTHAYIEVRKVVTTAQALKIFALLAEASD